MTRGFFNASILTLERDMRTTRVIPLLQILLIWLFLLTAHGPAFGLGANSSPFFTRFYGGWEGAGGQSSSAPENPAYRLTSVALTAPVFQAEVALFSNQADPNLQPYLYVLNASGDVVAEGEGGRNRYLRFGGSSGDMNARGVYEYTLVVATTGARSSGDFRMTILDGVQDQWSITGVEPCYHVYDDLNYGGRSKRIASAEYVADGFWNDRISSMRIPKGAYVRAWEHNGSGTRRTFHGHAPTVGTALDNRITKLESGLFDFTDFFMVFQADPQVEWSKQETDPNSVQGRWEVAQGLSEEGAAELYNTNISRAINRIEEHVGRRKMGGVVINGDLTEFGNQDNDLNQFKSYCIDPVRANVYPGLGNHDYSRDMSGPVDHTGTPGVFNRNRAAADMVNFMHDYRQTLPTVNRGEASQYYHWIKGDQITRNLAYSWEIGNIHFVQTHNHPSFSISFRRGEWGCAGDVYTIPSSIDWLRDDVSQAVGKRRKVILNMHIVDDGGSGNADYWSIVDNNPAISSVFVGHNHVLARQTVTRGNPTPREISTFGCGSPDNGTFLVARFRGDVRMYVWKMRVQHMNGANLQIWSESGGQWVDFDSLRDPFAVRGTTHFAWSQSLN